MLSIRPLGGVLIEGEKGTAKSTAVRATGEPVAPMESGASAMTVVELPTMLLKTAL